MSSTNRGAERREADFYPTPAWVTERLLQHIDLPGGEWLEPGAGEGAIIRAVNSVRRDIQWAGYELRAGCAPFIAAAGGTPLIGDFLAHPFMGIRRYRVAMGNPPFSLAQEFVTHALTMADQVVFLLRLSFLESQKRESFFKSVGAPDIFVLPERPSFTGEGTDSCAYAWMRWKRDRSQEGRVSILYDTRQQSLFGVP